MRIFVPCVTLAIFCQQIEGSYPDYSKPILRYENRLSFGGLKTGTVFSLGEETFSDEEDDDSFSQDFHQPMLSENIINLPSIPDFVSKDTSVPVGELLYDEGIVEGASQLIKQYSGAGDLKEYSFNKCLKQGHGRGVYLAEHKGVQYAVKRISMRPDDANLIANEILVMEKVTPSPYLLHSTKVIKHSYSNDIYIVMPYIEGNDLFKMWKANHKCLNLHQIAHLCHDILLALSLLHSEQIIHMDVKLHNIIYDPASNTFKLADYGLVGRLGSFAKARGSIDYMSPEIFRDFEKGVKVPLSPSMDLFSLGSSLLLLVEGNHPNIHFQDVDQIAHNILSGKVKLSEPYRYPIELVDFMNILLDMDWHVRNSADDLLNHPFLIKYYYNSSIAK